MILMIECSKKLIFMDLFVLFKNYYNKFFISAMAFATVPGSLPRKLSPFAHPASLLYASPTYKFLQPKFLAEWIVLE